jgi:hypothetical protein
LKFSAFFRHSGRDCRNPVARDGVLNFGVANATVVFNRVPAPEGAILSFASPKESIQRKGDPVAACFLRSVVFIGGWNKLKVEYLCTNGMKKLKLQQMKKSSGDIYL